MSAKLGNKKKLTIETNEDSLEGEGNQLAIKMKTQSARHSAEGKNFGFVSVRNCRQTLKLTRDQKIQQLEKQKNNLQHSLSVLKKGAIQAIEQKQRIISKLMNRLSSTYQSSNEQQSQSSVQMQNLLSYVRQLQSEKKDLLKEIQKQRQVYQQEIYEREQRIEELLGELQLSGRRVEELEHSGYVLAQELKGLYNSMILGDQQSVNLSKQNQKVKDEEREKRQQQEDIDRQKEKVKILQTNKSESSIMNQNNCVSDYGSGMASRKKSNNFFGEDSIDISRSFEQSVILQLKDLKSKHEQEIKELTQFYENRIKILKKVWDQSAYLSTSNPIPHRSYTPNILTQPDTISTPSSHSSSTPYPPDHYQDIVYNIVQKQWDQFSQNSAVSEKTYRGCKRICGENGERVGLEELEEKCQSGKQGHFEEREKGHVGVDFGQHSHHDNGEGNSDKYRSLKKNLSLGSFKSIKNFQMATIPQRQQLETSLNFDEFSLKKMKKSQKNMKRNHSFRSLCHKGKNQQSFGNFYEFLGKNNKKQQQSEQCQEKQMEKLRQNFRRDRILQQDSRKIYTQSDEQSDFGQRYSQGWNKKQIQRENQKVNENISERQRNISQKQTEGQKFKFKQANKKYFQCPNTTWRKTKSKKIFSEDEKLELSKCSQNQQVKQNYEQNHIKQIKQKDHGIWEKIAWFTSGTIFGGVVIGLTQKVFK